MNMLRSLFVSSCVFYGTFFIVLCLFSGCAATGTKSVDIGGILKWENYAGQQVQIGYNNIDEVNDHRGVGHSNPTIQTAKW